VRPLRDSRPLIPPGPGMRRALAPRRSPTSTELALYCPLIVLALIGLASPYEYNILRVNPLLEAALLLSVLTTIRTLHRRAVGILLIACSYVLVKYLLMTELRPASLTDFVQAYKAYVYVGLLSFFIGKARFSRALVTRVTDFLTLALLVKYLYSIVFQFDPRLADRPGLYTENNFELILLLGLFYIAYPHFAGSVLLRFAAVAAIVFMSGSRSASVGLFLIYVFIYLRLRSRYLLLHLAGTGLLGSAVLVLFASRLGEQGLTQVDRYRFLQVFFLETQEWSSANVLLGTVPLSPLSNHSCALLSYYAPLFSQSDPDTCYAVILHSFLLRAVIDQGLLGLGLLYVLIWFGMRSSAMSLRDRLALLALVSANALSVSAFNSVYVAIVFAVAFALDRTPRDPPSPPRTPVRVMNS
jgi:hypothetical protein